MFVAISATCEVGPRDDSPETDSFAYPTMEIPSDMLEHLRSDMSAPTPVPTIGIVADDVSSGGQTRLYDNIQRSCEYDIVCQWDCERDLSCRQQCEMSSLVCDDAICEVTVCPAIEQACNYDLSCAQDCQWDILCRKDCATSSLLCDDAVCNVTICPDIERACNYDFSCEQACEWDFSCQDDCTSFLACEGAVEDACERSITCGDDRDDSFEDPLDGSTDDSFSYP